MNCRQTTKNMWLYNIRKCVHKYVYMRLSINICKKQTYDVCFRQYVIFDTPHADLCMIHQGQQLAGSLTRPKACAHGTARAHLASGGGISSSAHPLGSYPAGMGTWGFPKIVVFPSKSSILIGFSIINHAIWGTPIFGNTHMISLFKFHPFSGFQSLVCGGISYLLCLSELFFARLGNTLVVEPRKSHHLLDFLGSLWLVNSY